MSARLPSGGLCRRGRHAAAVLVMVVSMLCSMNPPPDLPGYNPVRSPRVRCPRCQRDTTMLRDGRRRCPNRHLLRLDDGVWKLAEGHS